MTDHSAQYSFSFLLPPSSQPIKPNKLLRCYNREGQSLEFVNVIKSSSNAWVALYENKEEKQKKIVKWVGKDSKSVFTKLMHAKKTGVLQYGVEFGWFVCEQPVFVYEYVETLHHTRKNPLAQLDAIDLLDQLIENLCRQHIQGHFVHSDIKPENIGYRVVVDKSKKKEYFFIDWDDSICGKEVFEKQERLVHTQQICVYEPFDLFPSLDALVFVGLWREEILECIVSVLSLVFAHELPDPGKDPAVFRTLVQKRVPCYQMTDAKMLASMSLLEQRIFQALLFIWGYPNGSTLIPQKVWYSRLRSIIRGEVVCSTIEMALAVPRGMKTLEKNKVLASMAYEEQGVGIEYASLDSTLCGRMMQDLLLDTIRIQNEHRFLLAVVHPKHICMCAKNGRFFWSKSTPVTPLGSFGIFGALRSEDIERTLPTDFLYPIFHPAHHSYTTPNLYPRVWQMDLIDIVHMCFWLEKKQLVKDIQTMLIDMVNTKYDTVVASILCIFFVCWQVQVKFFSVPCLTNENRRQYEKNEKNTIRTNHNRRQYERTTIDGNTNDRQTAIRKNDELQYKQTMQDDDLTCDSPIQNVQNLCDGHDQKMSVSESPIRRPEIYKPQFLIGQGTYGSVAVSSFDKNIVVKTSEPSFAFYNEVATFHQLKGVPGIPKYHGFSLKDGCAQLFLERYPLCLTAFLNQVANPACFLPSIVRQLTLIVAACHVRGVVHSDISLNNILVRPLYNTNNSSAAAANHHPKPGLTISTASASSRQHMPNEDDKKEDNSSTNLLSKSFDNNNAIVDVEIALCDFGCSHMFVFGKDIVSMAQYVTTAPWRAPEISEQEKSPELRFTPKIDVFSMGMIFCDILFWKSLSMQIINKRNCKDDTKMVLQEIKNPTRKVDPNLALFLPCLLESNPKKRITAGHLLFDSHFQRYCGLKVDFLVFPMSPNGDPFNKNNKNLDGLRNIAEKLCESVFNECGLSFLEKHTRNLIKTQACSIIWKYEHRKTIDPQVLIVFVCCACVLACSHQCIQPSLDRINRLFFPYLSLSILQSVMDDLFCTTEGNIFS